MSEHHASVTVNAPIQQVYELFTHFNDFPKFMRFVKEVTYYDDQRSHWVAQIAGTHEWDAVNEDWIPGQQIGWRSINGQENSGRVKFTPPGENRTQIDVFITYNPPAGILGEAVDRLGFDSRFDTALQEDLTHFARMVEQAPPGSLDPMQSHYLFHDISAVSQKHTTRQQEASMQADLMMQQGALQQREQTIRQQEAQAQENFQKQEKYRQQRNAEQERAAQEQVAALNKQAEINRQESQEQEQQKKSIPESGANTNTLDSVHGTIGGRNASMERTAIGDQDARTERFPGYHKDPMLSRDPQKQANQQLSETEIESPWHTSRYGQEITPKQVNEENTEKEEPGKSGVEDEER